MAWMGQLEISGQEDLFPSMPINDETQLQA